MNLSTLIKNSLMQKLTAGLAVLLGALLIIGSLHKNISLVVNGDTQMIETYRLTVNGVLKSQGLFPGENDRLDPEKGKILWGDQVIYLNIASQVTVEADGKIVELTSSEKNPSNLILEAGLALYPKDRLVVDGSPAGERTKLTPGASHHIQLIRATLVHLIMEDGNLGFLSDGRTLEEALENEGIKVLEGDDLSLPLDTPLDGTPLKVELVRAIPVQVHLSDRTIQIRTTAEKIGPALAGAGLALQGLDFSVPAENELIPENKQIQLIRVREEIILNQDPIAFSNEYQPADDLELDQVQLISGGEFGLSGQRLRILYENGEEVSRELEKEWVIKEPKPRVVGYGTQINLRTENTPDGQITYWRKITAWATSYDSTCPGCDTITSSGTVLKKGTVAVTLDWYRYMKFAPLYIPGYGFGRVEDVGGGVPWSVNWVDLGYKKGEYVPWSQNVTVYFLAPAPSPDQIMYILY